MPASLIECGQEQGIPNPRLEQDSAGDLSPAHYTERFGLGAREIVAHRTLFPDFRVHSSSVENQGLREEGILPTAALRHNSDQKRKKGSEGSTQMPSGQSEEERGAVRGKKRERDRGIRSKTAHIYGAGASDHLDDNDSLPPKQYTRFWYCHMNCHHCGPWRSEITRCLGCEHDRCNQCKEETVVTRDPSAPRR